MSRSLFVSLLFLIGSFSSIDAANINPSRLGGPVPLAVYFSQHGPAHYRYEWNFGDGTKAEGFQAAHIFEEPGDYTVTLKETRPDGSVSMASVLVRARSFTGQTFYIDGINGNDNNNGLSPQSAWRSARKVQTEIMNRSSANRKYLRFLLKRGSVFELPEGQWLSLHNVPGPIRISSYANPDGSDNPSLPKPIVRENLSRGVGSPRQEMISHLVSVKDVVYQNVRLIGNYQYVEPDYNDRNYPTLAFNSLDDIVNTVFLRVEMDRFLGGIWHQYVNSGGRFLFIHDSDFRNMQSVPIFGHSLGYSLQDSRILYSATGHLHYVAPTLAVVKNNHFRGSGVFWFPDPNKPPSEWHRWYQCNLRFNSTQQSSSRPRAGRILVSENYLIDASAHPICVGQNPPEKFNTYDVVIEKNFIHGYVRPRDHMPGAGPVNVGSTSNLIFKNNVVWNPKGPLNVGATQHDGSPGPDPSDNINLVNNVFVRMTQDPKSFVRFTDNVSGTAIYNIKNNVFYGIFGAAFEFTNGWDNISGLEVDNNMYRPLNTAFYARLENGQGNWVQPSWQEWRNVYGFDQNSLIGVSPGWVSTSFSSPDFMKLRPDSVLIDKGAGTQVIDDMYENFRDSIPDIGVTEFMKNGGGSTGQ